MPAASVYWEGRTVSNSSLRLSLRGARCLMLAAQGLLERRRSRATKDDVLGAIRRMGALQIDTIQVIARSPYLVLWSRLGRYEPQWLDQLLVEGKLFEYWAHAACFLPIDDFPLFRPRMIHRSERSRPWALEHPAALDAVRQRLNEAGEVRSADFERTDGQAGSWWDWKPEKLALEYLFDTGEVMIARRERFQRVYAARERVLPGWDDSRTPAPQEARRELVGKTIRALGVTKARWIADYFRLGAGGMDGVLRELESGGVVRRAEVEGWDAPGYVHRDNLPLAERAAARALRPTLTTLLSPFDPLIWDRARVEDLFGFSYRIEVYTPSHRRRYGYFTLPILHRGRLVGRLDPKAHRKEGRFTVQSLHLEPGVRVTETLLADLSRALVELARWHGTPAVEILRSDPPEVADLLTERWNGSPDRLRESLPDGG
ncbi:MAG TPA: crosslink repair DNA glycosylase YcaQ family protein [Chloroflexota bacterium]|nr:crosslink repair DNA glycosylase YcaQ family protein [Chloroflexota bacterium]